MEYSATTVIDAPPDRVWSVLVDTASYPEWDPFCIRIEGAVAPGAKLKAYSKLSPGRGFAVKVTELEPHRRMTWRGGMPFGLFEGVRTFDLTPRGGATEFALREVFRGPMLGMIRKSIPDMTEAFEAFAAGLKERSERA